MAGENLVEQSRQLNSLQFASSKKPTPVPHTHLTQFITDAYDALENETGDKHDAIRDQVRFARVHRYLRDVHKSAGMHKEAAYHDAAYKEHLRAVADFRRGE